MQIDKSNIADYVTVVKDQETVLSGGYLVAINSTHFVVCVYKVGEAASKLVHYETIEKENSIESYLSQNLDIEQFVISSLKDSAFEYHKFSLSDHSFKVVGEITYKHLETGTHPFDPENTGYKFLTKTFDGYHIDLEYGLPVGFNIYITSVSPGLITGVWRGLKFCSKGSDLADIKIGVLNNAHNNPRQLECFQVNKAFWVEKELIKSGAITKDGFMK